jgi:L-glyceraldehyde 3-phosphate reductase
MLNRWIETDGLVDTLDELGIGSIVFSPLAQGMLTAKYLGGIPGDSRAALNHFLKTDFIRPEIIDNVRKLNEIAERRGQTLAQMAIAWVLRGGRITSALIGASRSAQIVDCVKALEKPDFTVEELAAIDTYSQGADINLWKKSAELD